MLIHLLFACLECNIVQTENLKNVSFLCTFEYMVHGILIARRRTCSWGIVHLQVLIIEELTSCNRYCHIAYRINNIIILMIESIIHECCHSCCSQKGRTNPGCLGSKSLDNEFHR